MPWDSPSPHPPLPRSVFAAKVPLSTVLLFASVIVNTDPAEIVVVRLVRRSDPAPVLSVVKVPMVVLPTTTVYVVLVTSLAR
jgi:hypothetical protein